MTRLTRQELDCPNCYTSFSITYFASINTWMNPELTQDFLEGKGYIFNCPSCNQGIRFVTTILISAGKGMFNISTDATKEERRKLYEQYGLIDEKGTFGNPQDDWVRRQLAKINAPEDSNTQIRRQEKIMEEIHKKLQLYEEKLKENSPLDDSEEEEFKTLQSRWEKEREKEETYLHHPKTQKSNSNPSVLFHKLWEDLMILKTELNKLK